MVTTELLISPRGRINRASYWAAAVPLLLLVLLGWLLSGTGSQNMAMAGAALGVLSLWPLVAVNIKRWHDRDKSGWWMLVLFLPVIGILWSFVELGLLAGNVGYNAYGKPPPATSLPLGGDKSGAKAKGDSGSAKSYADSATEARDRLGSQLVGQALLAGLMMRLDWQDHEKKADLIENHFKSQLGLEAKSFDDAMAVTMSARFSNDSFREQAEAVRVANSSEVEKDGNVDTFVDTSALNTVSDFLFEIANADGRLTDTEEVLLVQLHQVFGFNGALYSSHKFKERHWRGEEHIASGGQDRYYANLLGLGDSFTAEDVKKAFRIRVKEYHPDKVARMGEEAMEAADKEMKKLNEAYQYFKHAFSKR